MQLEFYQRVNEALQHGTVAIATVVEINGSVPREIGAKMMIEATGHTTGTIGGGAGEAKVIEVAIALLHDLHSSQHNPENSYDQKIAATSVTIDLTGAKQRQTQGVCGGTMQVWISCWQLTWGQAIAQSLCQRLKEGQTTQLVTPLSVDQTPYLRELNSSRIHPNALASEDSPDLFSGFQPHFPSLTAAPETDFLELICPNPTLLISGAGHVGIALAEAATFAGFRVMIQDDRPDFAAPHRFHAISPEMTVLNGAIAPVLRDLPQIDELYIALVTRGVAHDLEALECLFSPAMTALRQRIQYVGMIGSRKRVRHVFQQLEQRGVEGDRLRSIYAPIGVDIGALTPTEIAISICAELIQVRRSVPHASLLSN